MPHPDVLAAEIPRMPAAVAPLAPLATATVAGHEVECFDGAALPALDWPAAADDARLDAYVYQSREFLDAWAATVGAARGSRLLLVRVVQADSAPGGRPVLWLPLVVEREFGCSILRFPDAGMADYNAPVLDRGFVETGAAMASLWPAILRVLPKVDLVDFVKMPATIWQQPNPMLRLDGMVQRDEGYYLPITGTHADYLADPSRKGRVRKLGQLFRKLGRSGHVEIGEVRDGDALAQARSFLERHKSAQYKRTAIADQFERPGIRLFIDRLCQPASLASFTRMTALRLDGAVIAAQLDFVTPRRQQGFITTFDAEKHSFISPGRQVQLHLIARAFADKLEVFDLGHGNNLFKHPWMSHVLPLHDLEEARTLRGRAYLAARGLRRRLPKGLGARAMRLLRRQLPASSAGGAAPAGAAEGGEE